MEKHIVIKKSALINLSILQMLERLRLLIRLCEGFKNRIARLEKLMALLRSKKSQFAKQKELMEFKRTLVGMNSFTDMPIIPKGKDPLKRYEIEKEIKDVANDLWLAINDGQ